MTLVGFLAVELAPFPGRLRAALRILVGCVAALLLTAVLGADLSPHAHWTITTIFTVSQADAGASLRRSLQRIVGTLAGGALGILAVIAFADLPQFYAPVLGAVVGVGLFASLTTTASYVMLLGTITFVLVTFLPPGADAAAAVSAGLWRIVAITIGVACGAGAQLFVLPDDPEDKLRASLAARLQTVAGVLATLAARLSGRETDMPPAPRPRLSGDDLTNQLDLLANAESRHRAIRRRHTEQLSLIMEIDRVLTAAVWLADAAPGWGTSPRPALAREVDALGRECAEIARALQSGRPPVASPVAELDGPGADPDLPGLRPTLDDVRLALQRARGALGFLDPDHASTPALDQPPRRPLLTPAFSIHNTDAVLLGLKAAVGLEICWVLMHGLAWSALLTAGVTVVLISQTSFGATVQKSILRVAGSTLGGALGMAVIIVAMPNIENIGSLLVVAGLGLGVAAWITAGSSRISYMGLQTGLAFAVCVTDPSGPTTNLVPGRDRVLGILIGVLAMMLVNATIAPVRARQRMRPALSKALRSIAALARVVPETQEYRARLASAVRFRSAVYGDLATTLRLVEESKLEPDAASPDALVERTRVTRLAADAQAVFLALLTLLRHRLSTGLPDLPASVQEEMRALDGAVGDVLDALASRIAGEAARPIPDLAEPLATLEAALPTEPTAPPAPGPAVSAAVALRDHVAIARDLVQHVAVLREAVDALPSTTPA